MTINSTSSTKCCYHPTSQQKIGCFLGVHDWKEYELMKGKYYCLRIGCKAFIGFGVWSRLGYP